ncbi:MAG: cellulase family glycosylhydrolase [Candidatus Obscuribacter sp.]|nr:cellulase family glycosylhydrolase [Candidatus Obscuribacter sp.]MBP6348714.1 cellulase family glycosylhydrolase [Candidatus Obscuribacter sp.]MBP6592335.1 cellulase family glycosylhydrolase [Candidatus Obscuribacter sp.]MBP7576290.1 cellulase family glycosylhydrolase [Candidatus Obscuribacter sp.]
MPNPCNDQTAKPSDNQTQLKPSENLGIVSAAQDAYQPQCGTDRQRTPGCSMPGNRAQELLFDDIFKAIDQDHNGAISRNEFSNFGRAVQPIFGGGNDNPGHCPGDRPVPRPPVDVPTPRPPIDTPLPRPPVDVPTPGPKPPVDAPPPGPKPPVDVPTPGPKPPVDAPHPGPKPPVDVPTPRPPVDVPTPGPIHGNFTTRDGKIYDPSGKEFQPRGFDVDDINVALQDIDKITKDWSANIIRINAPQLNKVGLDVNKNGYDHELMQKVVDEYTKRGVVVEVLDGIGKWGTWGSISSAAEVKEREKFAKEIAAQFKDNPYVWFATPNETGAVMHGNTPQDRDWLNEELTYDKAIRSTGNQNIIVQGDAFWGQGATAGGESAIVRHADEFKKIGNIVAGQHVYNPSKNAARQLTDAIKDLREEGFAVVVDEFSNKNGGAGLTPPVDTANGANAVMDAVEELGIGALPFRWKETRADQMYNFTVRGRGNGARTPWGQQVWDMTHGD